MMIYTTNGMELSGSVLSNYFRSLVNMFFKILPIKEAVQECGEASLVTYMQSLQMELLGCKGLVVAIDNDPLYLSLLSILQYMIDHPACETSVVRREVFRAISICNKLKTRYAEVTNA